MVQRPENPFGSHYTRPGALPFLLPDALGSEEQWLEQLLSKVLSEPRTAIVGPHGSGKSTLLSLIREQLSRDFSGPVEQVTLRIGQPHTELWQQLARLIESLKNTSHVVDLVKDPGEPPSTTGSLTRSTTTEIKTNDDPVGVMIIDGFEQLGWLGRMQLAWKLRPHSIRLLVTAHQSPLGFDVLVKLDGDKAIAQKLAKWLLQDFPELLPLMDQQFEAFWTQAQGNVRDLWAILYDWFEVNLHVVKEVVEQPKEHT